MNKMRKLCLLASVAATAVGLAMVSVGSASAAPVTCPIGQNGIHYQYDAARNMCVPVKQSSQMSQTSFTQQSYPASATPAMTVKTPTDTLAAGDGT